MYDLLHQGCALLYRVMLIVAIAYRDRLVRSALSFAGTRWSGAFARLQNARIFVKLERVSRPVMRLITYRSRVRDRFIRLKRYQESKVVIDIANQRIASAQQVDIVSDIEHRSAA